MEHHINQLLTHITDLCSVSCHIFNVKALHFKDQDCFCHICTQPCDYAKTHLYGCYEAQRWDGRYIYYCPRGFIFIAIAILNELDMVEDGIIAGPLLMGNPDDILPVETVPFFSTTQVHSLTELLHCLCCTAVPNNSYNITSNTGTFLNAVYNALEDTQETSSYPISLEKELQQAIMQGDAVLSRDLLNRLLGHIFFYSNSDLNQIKSRVLELIALLSRSAIEGGADVEQIFSLNNNYIQEVQSFENIEKLSLWLGNVINRFVSYVFDFANIKHINIIYKTIDYIKANYMKKISLDEIAQNVYISKSYLSRLFKEEMQCSITGYINKLRISHSKILLTDASLPLADVSNLVGFEDQSYFTKIFKNITGISPGKYREKSLIIKGADYYEDFGRY